jgi:hypothetical protein
MKVVVFIDLIATMILPASYIYAMYLIFLVMFEDLPVSVVLVILYGIIMGIQVVVFILRSRWEYGKLTLHVIQCQIFINLSFPSTNLIIFYQQFGGPSSTSQQVYQFSTSFCQCIPSGILMISLGVRPVQLEGMPLLALQIWTMMTKTMMRQIMTTMDPKGGLVGGQFVSRRCGFTLGVNFL